MTTAEFLRDERERILWISMTRSSWRYYSWLALLLAAIGWGIYAYSVQLREGLIVTGLRDQISWGIYITNFVFFIGISHAGTLISSILRLTHAQWRQPVTRLAEIITVAALFIGGTMPIIDMGRPDRLANIVIFGRIQSNLVWDIISVTTYLTGSILFLWLLMVPDIALLRDHYPNPGRLRKGLYAILALGYGGNQRQHNLLEKANHAMTIIILPLAVSVHTVVAWIFAMSLRPGWNSSIFGPYFVVGAIFSGIAASIVAMYVFRRCYRLESYLAPLHFRNLGYLLLTMTLVYLYFNINEYLTIGYKMAEYERHLLQGLFSGQYSWMFWGVQIIGVLLPAFLLGSVLGVKSLRERYAVFGTVTASALVLLGAWIKRYVIVVPTLSSPHLPAQELPWDWTNYRPTWVEWSITAAAIAGFLLIYTLMSKLFPIISIWETREAARKSVTEPEEGAFAERQPRWATTSSARVLVIVALLLISAPAKAKSHPMLPQPTTLTIESTRTGEPPKAVVTVVATLSDADGMPVPDMPVQLEMKMLFGKLDFGIFPTNEEGKAILMLRDKRYGAYPVRGVFEGDNTYGASEVVTDVDFGPRPAPSLPSEGVLISPDASLSVLIPFLIFYGSCWVVFLYAGYIAVWRMRRDMPSPKVTGIADPKGDILRILKAKLEMIEKDGYEGLVNRHLKSICASADSLACLSFPNGIEPHECRLLQFVPPERCSEAAPCHHIPLNEAGETLAMLEARGDNRAMEKAVRGWLRLTIKRLEQRRAVDGYR
ncbi:MAG: NrfD/PsrC family molybdoenzyme membrane anchor subunit [Acidobacteriota bacterium]